MLLSFYPASSCDVDDCGGGGGGGGGGSRSTIMGSYMINDDDDKMIMMTASFPSFRKCSPEKWGVRELPRWKWVDGAQLVRGRPEMRNRIRPPTRFLCIFPLDSILQISKYLLEIIELESLL